MANRSMHMRQRRIPETHACQVTDTVRISGCADEGVSAYTAVVETKATYFFRRFCAAGDNSVKAKPKN